MLKFSVQTPDLGEAADELAVRYTGDALDIGFNANYLLEILRFIPTDEVRLTFKAPERAATIGPGLGESGFVPLSRHAPAAARLIRAFPLPPR